VITTADVWKRMVPVGTNISIAFGVVFYGFSIYIRQDAAGADFSTRGHRVFWTGCRVSDCCEWS